MRKRTAATLLLTAVVFGGLAVAQQNQTRQVAQSPKPKSIFIGQSLESVSAILKQQAIEFGEGGYAVSVSDPDCSILSFTLDENHTTVCASYSKSKQIITGLTIVCVPSRKSGYKVN